MTGNWFPTNSPIIASLADVMEYSYETLAHNGDFKQRIDDAQFLHDMMNQWSEILRRQVYARWTDGTYCLPDGELQAFAAEREALMKEDSLFQTRYRHFIYEYRDALRDIALTTLAAHLAKKSGVADSEVASIHKAYQLSNRLATLAELQGNPGEAVNPINFTANKDGSNVWQWSNDEVERIHNAYRDLGARLSARVWSIQKWGYVPYESFGHWRADRFPHRNIRPIIDPSGFVYEAVEGNRLAGVQATIYYQQNDGETPVAQLWNAEQYGQINPQLTGEDGMYQWDVPQGLWQVKFEKEGYETTYTDWLPVPPPQLEINIPMVENRAPQVATVHAFKNRVEVAFDKYMKSETLIPAFVMLLQEGKRVEADVKIVDAESNALARHIEVVPKKALDDGMVTLFVSQHVSSYANRGLEADFSAEYAIEPELTAIAAPDTIRVAMGDSIALLAQVETPAAAVGKTLRAASASAAIAAVGEPQMAEDGSATIGIMGRMVGQTTVHLSVQNYRVEKNVVIEVVNRADYTTAAPMASIESGEVESGSAVELTCEDTDAVIYYTTDGSSPADSPTRSVYDGSPIIVNATMELRIAACNEQLGLYASATAVYVYTVESTAIAQVNNQDALSASFAQSRLVVETSETGGTLTVANAMGQTIAATRATARRMELDAQSLSPGIYVVSLRTTAGKVYSQKLLKR